jgi:hypothetical protein
MMPISGHTRLEPVDPRPASVLPRLGIS